MKKKGKTLVFLRGLLSIILYFRIFLVFLILVLLTIAVAYLIMEEEYFQRFHWFRFSITLSLLTCLWPYTMKRVRLKPGEIVGESGVTAFLYAIMIPSEIWLLVPRFENMPHNAGFAFAVAALHAIGFYAAYIARKIPPRVYTIGDVVKAYAIARHRGPDALAIFWEKLNAAADRFCRGHKDEEAFFSLLEDDQDEEGHA